MRIGTKSLLFGVHQFLLHPAMVTLAWRRLYHSWPSWRELVCIALHDWGYWGKAAMDDEEGERHPELGAKIAGRLLGPSYHDLCLYHSRHVARNHSCQPSRLCWPDKRALKVYGKMLYLFLGHLTGEIAGYRKDTAAAGLFPIDRTDGEWYEWVSAWFDGQIAAGLKGEAIAYVNRRRVAQ